MKLTGITILSTAAIAIKVSLAQSVGSCAAQEVLSTCLSNQDIYLKTCIDQDYVCLCKWHTAKLSCYDNCPQDLGRAAEQGMKDTFCSIASTYNTTSSSIPAVMSSTSLMNMPSNTQSAAMPSSSSVNNNSSKASGATGNQQQQGVFMLIAGLTAAAASCCFLV